MNKEQIIIEEMAIDVMNTGLPLELAGAIATDLYEKDYRKVDEEAQGKWQFWKVPSYSVSVTHELICNICGYRVEMLKGRHYNFCPNCGAQMKGAE